MKKVLGFAAALAMVAFASTRAQATPIGQITTADGLVFTISDDGAVADLFAGDSTSDTEQFSVTLDTSGYTGTNTDVFSDISLKLVNGAYDDEQLVTAPTLTAGNTWVDHNGGLNNGACNDSGTGFFCTDVESGGSFNSTGGVLLDGSSYLWTWYVDPGTGGFSLPGEIKAQWFTSGGDKVNQISQPFVACTGTDCGGELPPPTVPEPTTLLLLSSGLAGVVGSKLRRRRSA